MNGATLGPPASGGCKRSVGEVCGAGEEGPRRTKRPIPFGIERHTTAWHHPVAASGAPKGYVLNWV